MPLYHRREGIATIAHSHNVAHRPPRINVFRSIFARILAPTENLTANQFQLLPTEGDTVFPHVLNPLCAEFGKIIHFLYLLQCSLGLILKLRFSFRDLKFHQDASLPFVLWENSQIKAPIAAFSIGTDMVPRDEYSQYPKHKAVIETFMVGCIVIAGNVLQVA